MITSQVVIDLINEQIRNELQSHQIYLAMSAWFETTPYKRFAGKFKTAAMEEHAHAMKFFNFLADRDGRIKMLALPEPQFDFSSPVEAAKAALAQERAVSGQIRFIYKTAFDEGDYETVSFLSWFLDEQVEEEKTAKDFLEYVEAAGENAAAILELDEAAGATSAPA